MAMSENTFNTDLKARIIKLVDENNRDEIIRILCIELKDVKLEEESSIFFCRCGYPLSYGTESFNCKNEVEYSSELIKEILREEADFDHYRLEYYCPKCGEFLSEVQC